MARKLLLLACLLLLGATRVPAYEVSAWTFGDYASLSNASDAGAIHEVSVDWYSSNADLTVSGGGEDPAFVAAARAQGLRVLATVTNWSEAAGEFDPDLASLILADRTSRAIHAKAITQMCLQKGYDGIDLDWESLHASDRQRFSKFVTKLANKLHRKGKILSIAVHAKESEPGDWDGAIAQNWLKIGYVVDLFKIMTYDYSGPWSGPGPVAPPDWADSVLGFAETQVPASKIMMGVPFYGYDWSGGSAEGVDWTGVQTLISAYNPVVARDLSGEATFDYVEGGGGGTSHTVFFQDVQALTVKLQMMTANHPAIRGIAIWCMGGEDPGFWSTIATQLP